MLRFTNLNTGWPISLYAPDIISVDETADKDRTVLVMKDRSEIPVRGEYERTVMLVELEKKQVDREVAEYLQKKSTALPVVFHD